MVLFAAADKADAETQDSYSADGRVGGNDGTVSTSSFSALLVGNSLQDVLSSRRRMTVSRRVELFTLWFLSLGISLRDLLDISVPVMFFCF